MRDELSKQTRSNPELTAGDINVIHVFRILISYGVYNPNSKAHGFVSRKMCSYEDISKESGFSTRTIKHALTTLERNKWIKRHPRSSGIGRMSSDIELCWLTTQRGH